MLMSILIAIYVSIAIFIMCNKTAIDIENKKKNVIDNIIINIWLAIFWPIVFIIYSFNLFLEKFR